MVYLQKWLPTSSYNKLKPKKHDPYQVLKKINDNAYLIKFSPNMISSPTFNINDVYKYHVNLDEDSMMNFLGEEEIDVVHDEKNKEVKGLTMNLGHKGKVTLRPN